MFESNRCFDKVLIVCFDNKNMCVHSPLCVLNMNELFIVSETGGRPKDDNISISPLSFLVRLSDECAADRV